MEWILYTIKVAGYRNSTVRNSIIEVISRSCAMFAANDIITKLPKVDRVTVYRTLDILSELDIIHPTLVRDGAQYYELHTPEHHHHAMCTHCTAQECVDCAVPSTPGKHHTLFYSFTCINCSQ
jgi:Fur family ferric uptake transcriptional regulator